MEFVCIEAKTFEDMRMALELLKKKVETLSQRHLPKRLDKWLDNQEVCAILHISPRTLQSLRSNGTLSYTQIDRRTYYQEQDVMRLLGMTGYRRKSRKESER
ncbi:helix-turn-helix domain-containing protein [Bacteroides sp. An269]|uniref:helix-turn-helix domain-containing protein n=1 Tax=Bacteroides sp. An269 TaxID=1965613 RepID=UPI000B36E734|nr:helix-turn-helix domain-containing protein [Bacteroides sp. An269]OUO70691.1 DNA-binding protein [Bacteroides sp. An269]